MQAVDTNVLVYAHLPATVEHERVRRFLQERLAAPVTLAVTTMVLHELVHVITDPRRFDPPVTMSEGLAIARLCLGRSNISCLAPDEEAVADAFTLLERHQLGRKRIADTLLAATPSCGMAWARSSHAIREISPRSPGSPWSTRDTDRPSTDGRFRGEPRFAPSRLQRLERRRCLDAVVETAPARAAGFAY